MRERGVTDIAVLAKMARTDRLSRQDLLWAQTNGTEWIRADSVSNLFPDLPPAPTPEPQDQAEAPPVGQTAPAPVRARRGTRGKKLVATMFVVMVAVAAWKLEPSFRKLAPSSMNEPEVVPHNSHQLALEQAAEQIVALTPEIEEAMTLGEFQAARELIEQFSPMAATNDVVKALALRLEETESNLVALDGLKDKLAAGTLDLESAQQLLALTRKHDGNTDNLYAVLRRMLASTGTLSASHCLSVIRMARVLDDKSLIATAAPICTASLDASFPPESCLEVSAMCIAADIPDQAMAILSAFLEKKPAADVIRLEFAALQCQAGRTKEARRSVRTATRSKNPDIKAKARADKRFALISDSWRFRRYTK